MSKRKPYSVRLDLDSSVLRRYLADPTNDRELRDHLQIPEDAYYEVGVWPVPGLVSVSRFNRVCVASKISKSTI